MVQTTMFQTTRRQLALWYTTVTAVLLLLFASGFYLYVRGTLIERIDDTLNHVVEVIQRSLVIEPINPHAEGGPLRVNLEASFRDNVVTSEDDHIDLEWFSPTGELLWSTFSEPLNLPLHPNSDVETVEAVKTDPSSQSKIQNPKSKIPDSAANTLLLRQVTHRIEIGRSVLGYLRVSHPWFEVTKPTRELFFDLALGTALLIAAVGAIGWFLSGLAMEPVRQSYQRLKQFTADASHELRSPIAIIQTNVQVALADPNPDPQTQQYHLQVVERLTRRLARLVDDLLFLARQDSGIVQSRWLMLDLGNLLQEVMEEQHSIAREKGIQLVLNLRSPSPGGMNEREIAPTYPLEIERIPNPALLTLPQTASPQHWTMLCGDRDQLARLFTNLIGNAVQYTPLNGKVEIELKPVSKQGHAWLQVRVRDTGIGIPEEALPHIFDRFYRVDPARSQASITGSGLGLAISQAIVQNHHGQIHIDSTVNQGTTITVTLPQKRE
jgi:OmpR-family two-component system manganese-sensing sensor histidine kinase